MKLRLVIPALAFAATAAISGVAVAQTPPAPANFVLRVPAPAYRATNVDWIPGHWVRQNGHRVYIKGHEEASPHRDDRGGHHAWVPGHWDTHRAGHRVWVEGHWS
jgi:hypothetical protein